MKVRGKTSEACGPPRAVAELGGPLPRRNKVVALDTVAVAAGGRSPREAVAELQRIRVTSVKDSFSIVSAH